MKLLKSKVRIIDQLRKLYPGTWVYDQQSGDWIGPDFKVGARASWAPQWDGDESFVVSYIRTDTLEQVKVY